MADTARTRYDAVLCDLDNVIRFFDHDQLHALERDFGLATGTTATIAFATMNDLPLLLGKATRAEWTDSIVRDLLAHVPRPRAEALADAMAHAPFHADAELVALLRGVRAHCPLVLVTNATSWLDDDLAALGLIDLADAVVNSAEVGVVKPDPRIYRLALERAGSPDPARCLFIDDRRENTDAAAALGLTAHLYRDLAGLRPHLP